jgi:site-specific recombinase XerD
MPEDAGTRQDLTEHDRKPRYTLGDLVTRFLTSCRHGATRSGRALTPGTLEYYRIRLAGLLYFASLRQWPAPAALTREHLHDFMQYLLNEPHRWEGDGRRSTFKKAAPSTVHHYLKVARTFFIWARDEGYLPDSPEIAALLRLRLPPANYRDVQPYSDDEVDALLNLCEHDIQYGYRYLGVRNRAIISVFIDTGLRLEELTGMKLSELDPQLQQVRILGKGNKWRTVPINGQARKALKIYLAQYRAPAEAGTDAVWLTDAGQPMTYAAVKIMLARLKRRAGVKSGGGAHRFRHYFATRCLENGMDMNSLRMLLGHATLYMVLRYTKFVDSRRAFAEQREFSPLDRLTRGGNYNHQGRNDNHNNNGWGWRESNRR